jgi:hypothetical protein
MIDMAELETTRMPTVRAAAAVVLVRMQENYLRTVLSHFVLVHVSHLASAPVHSAQLNSHL